MTGSDGIQDAADAWIEDVAKPVEALDDFIMVDVIDRVIVNLTEDEVNDRARAIAETLTEREVKQAEMKAAADDYKQHLKLLDKKLADLRRAVSSKTENQKVECTQVFDVKRERTWFLYRGVRTDERHMTDVELRETQRSLFKDAPNLPNRLSSDALDKPVRTAEELAKVVTLDDPTTIPANIPRIRRKAGDKSIIVEKAVGPAL